jgi:Domain of unknown function (DUF6894)
MRLANFYLSAKGGTKNLYLPRTPGCRAKKPLAPCPGFFVITQMQESQERHFVVTWRDRVREYGNTEGTVLQDEQEARRFAARLIRELKQAGEHADPELCRVVKDAQGREVFTLSF